MAHSCVAPNSTNTLTCLRLQMCRLKFAPLPPPNPNAQQKDTRAVFEIFMDGMGIEPLKNAYLLFLPISKDESMVVPQASDAFYCRTNDKGGLTLIEESEIDGGLAQGGQTQEASFQSGAFYSYFWTFSKDVFKRVVADVRANINDAINRHDFSSFEVVEQQFDMKMIREDNPLNLSLSNIEEEMRKAAKEGDKEKLLKLMEKGKVISRQLLLLKHNVFTPTSSYARYFSGGAILKAVPNASIDRGANYLFANCDVINALYSAELIHFHAISLRQKTMKDFAIFQQVKDICRMASEKARVGKFDKANKDNKHRDAYYEYAYQCARYIRGEDYDSGKIRNYTVERDDFIKAIDIPLNHPGSNFEVAKSISEKTGIPHPSADSDGKLTTEENFGKNYTGLHDRSPVLNYFDFYRFGTVEKKEPWYRTVTNTENEIARRLSSIQNELNKFMERRLPYDDFMCHLEAHFDIDFQKRKELHTRYLEMALNVLYPWWEKLDDETTWKKMEPYMQWLSESSEKLGHLFGEHFGDLETIQRYNYVVQGNVKRIEKMSDKLVRYNNRLNGKTIERKFKDTSFTIDFKAGTITFESMKQEQKMEGTFQFLMDVSWRTETRKMPTRKTAGAKRKRYRPAPVTFKEKTFHLTKIPLKQHRQWPAWLAAFGDAMALAISLKDLSDDLKHKEKIEVYGKLAQNTFKAVDSLSSALSTSFKLANKEHGLVSKFAKLGEIVKGPGLVLEAVFNVKEGTILLFDDESEARAAYRQGNEIEAWALEIKGLTLVGATASGFTIGTMAAGSAILVGEAAAAAFGAFLGPLGIGLAIAGLIVVGIEIFIYWLKGPDNIMNPIKDELDGAIKREFGEDWKKERTLDPINKFSNDMKKLIY